jgi:hypothetical protein
MPNEAGSKLNCPADATPTGQRAYQLLLISDIIASG